MAEQEMHMKIVTKVKLDNSATISNLVSVAEMTRRSIETAKNMMDYRLVEKRTAGEVEETQMWTYSEETRKFAEALIKDSLEKLKQMNNLIEFDVSQK